jgi:hypothetical protein
MQKIKLKDFLKGMTLSLKNKKKLKGKLLTCKIETEAKLMLKHTNQI